MKIERKAAIRWMIYGWLFTGIATFDLVFGIILFVLGSILTVITLILLPWILRLCKVLEKFRITIPLAIIASFALFVFYYTNKYSQNRDAVRLSLAGHIPSGIHEFYIHEMSFNDEFVEAYFKCNPDSLRKILAQPPFKLLSAEKQDDDSAMAVVIDPYAITVTSSDVFKTLRTNLSFKTAGLSEIRNFPSVSPILVYKRTDMPKQGSGEGFGQCYVFTDPAYSFAYIEYAWMDE